MNPEQTPILTPVVPPKRTKGQWIGTVVLLVIAGWLLGIIIWYQYNLRPVSASTQEKVVIIAKGDSVDTIANRLADNGLIRSNSAFTVYVTLHGLRGRLQTGAYQLTPNQTTKEIARAITAGKTAQEKITIPEGFTISAIRARVVANGMNGEAFDAALQQDLTGTKAAQRPAGTSLEGYLFPDTYVITPSTTEQQLVRSMIDHFDAKVTDDIIAGFAAQGLSLHQGLTLASMVEREVSIPADRKLVAGVFLNRLKIGQKLESDVTVDYGRALLGKPFNTGLDSPYNTYRIPALPIGPICNPGLESMRAVGNPTASGNYYFLAGKDGTTHYAVTADQHYANVQKYLR